jgi:glutamate-1-semialdehyde 2,1-aminomutase
MTLDRARLAALLAEEERRFHEAHPRSLALFERARRSLLGGVPMHWMVRWAGGFPLFVTGGEGAHLTDVDGHRYLDLCLGDTGAMTGHAPAATVAAVRAQAGRGFTFMLPTEDAVWVGEELARRFGLPYWQFAVTATDANRSPCASPATSPDGPGFSSSTGAITARWTRPSPRSRAAAR